MVRTRLALATLVSALITGALVGCGPPINALQGLPASIGLCGRDWHLDDVQAPVTLAQAASNVGAKPIVLFDLARPSCPLGACTAADLRVRLPLAGRCQTIVWVRVGLDAYVSYGLAHVL